MTLLGQWWSHGAAQFHWKDDGVICFVQDCPAAQPSLVISLLKHAWTWSLTETSLMCLNMNLNKGCIPNTDVWESSY